MEVAEADLPDEIRSIAAEASPFVSCKAKTKVFIAPSRADFSQEGNLITVLSLQFAHFALVVE